MWQDISTAPKDGTPVLAAYWDPFRACWEPTLVNWKQHHAAHGSWELLDPGSYAEDCEPLHPPLVWLPFVLPAFKL